MSSKSVILVLALIVAIGLGLSSNAQYYEQDQVIDFYWRQSAEQYRRHDPLVPDNHYRIVATTYYKDIAKRGGVEAIDSATVAYYVSAGRVDSQEVINGDNSRFVDLDLTFTDVFLLDYQKFGFPNDTGGELLAIGLATDSGSVQPEGLLVIDRDDYTPAWLYLYYPDRPGYRRFSRSFRFGEFEGYIFPDSIWEVAAKDGIFSMDHYRIETGVESIELLEN